MPSLLKGRGVRRQENTYEKLKDGKQVGCCDEGSQGQEGRSLGSNDISYLRRL